jgi:methylated-DNA-protein-cysteine methyltransferase-like protein
VRDLCSVGGSKRPLPRRNSIGWDDCTNRGALAAVSSTSVDTDRARDILAAVRATPEGFVRTYGDVSPGAPRVAGAVLHACGDADVPWHRIVRADGSLAKGRRQRALLEAEGIPFRGERVDMRVARLPTV